MGFAVSGRLWGSLSEHKSPCLPSPVLSTVPQLLMEGDVSSIHHLAWFSFPPDLTVPTGQRQLFSGEDAKSSHGAVTCQLHQRTTLKLGSDRLLQSSFPNPLLKNSGRPLGHPLTLHSAQRVTSWPSGLPSDLGSELTVALPPLEAGGRGCVYRNPAAGYSYTFRYRHASQAKEGGGVSGSQKPWNKYLAQCPGSGTAAGPLLLFSHSTLGYQQKWNPTPPPKQWPTKQQASATGVCLPCKSVRRAKTSSSNPSPSSVQVTSTPQPQC